MSSGTFLLITLGASYIAGVIAYNRTGKTNKEDSVVTKNISSLQRLIDVFVMLFVLQAVYIALFLGGSWLFLQLTPGSEALATMFPFIAYIIAIILAYISLKAMIGRYKVLNEKQIKLLANKVVVWSVVTYFIVQVVLIFSL